MPASSATYAPPRRRAGSRAGALPKAARVRWDRLGRIAMLLVGLALVFLYLSTGFHMLATLQQSHRASARVTSMEREHRRLSAEHSRLSSQATLEAQAKALGMQRPDEQTYIVGNLPSN